jgi:sugar phosphate isomerase/epimerase
LKNLKLNFRKLDQQILKEGDEVVKNIKKLMFSSRIFKDNIDAALDYAQREDYIGVEWYLNYIRLPINSESMENIFNKFRKYPNLYYTFHLPTKDIEIGHIDPELASASLKYLKMYISLLSPWFKKQKYRSILTMHIGANGISMESLDWQRTKENIKELAEHAYNSNAVLNIENLKTGWTSNPESHLKLIEDTKAQITFDFGHASSSALIREKELSIDEYLNKLQRVSHMHFYDFETLDTGEHIPPKSWHQIKKDWQLIDKYKDISGIVLELTSIEDLANTRSLILKNLS